MTKFKWYLHGPDQLSTDEYVKGIEMFMSDENKKKLATNLRNKFYEVEFEVETNEMTGQILKVTAKV